MNLETARRWLDGNLSTWNSHVGLVAPEDQRDAMVTAAQEDAALTGRAYWIVRAHAEGLLRQRQTNLEYVDVVFDGPPGSVAGRFVEVEGPDGSSVSFGEWIERPDGTWALRIKG